MWRSDTGRCVYEEEALEGAGAGGQATLLQVAPGGQTVMTATADCRLRFFAPKVHTLSSIHGASAPHMSVLWTVTRRAASPRVHAQALVMFNAMTLMLSAHLLCEPRQWRVMSQSTTTREGVCTSCNTQAAEEAIPDEAARVSQPARLELARQLVGNNDEVTDLRFVGPAAAPTHLAVATNSEQVGACNLPLLT